MSTAPDDEVTFDAPAKKKTVKKAKKPSAKKAAAPGKPSRPFPGMTRTQCANACGAKGCAVGTSYCAHPCKGGLQSGDMGNPTLLKQLQAARDQVDVRLDPDRFK